MAENLSLFGWPMPEPRDAAGRPEHLATDENRSKVMLLLALRYSSADIAKALGVSQPTLRKHYFQELEQRRVARLQLDATRFSELYKKVLAGDVSAMKELGKVVEKHDLAELDEKIGNRGNRPLKPAKLGKKQEQQVAAGEVGGVYAPPLPPEKMN